MPSKKDRPWSAAPRKPTRRHKVRVWFERGVLSVMMSVVAAVVERRLLKVIKTGGSSKAALQRAERDEARGRRGGGASDTDIDIGTGPDDLPGDEPEE